MKTVLILLKAVLLVCFSQAYDKNSGQNMSSNMNQPLVNMAEKIKIEGLQNALIQLQNGKTQFQFIGITSNGIDCIYFVYEQGKFNLEFEAIVEEQIPYIQKLKDFATLNNYKSVMTTYNNKSYYNSDKPAPVLRMEMNTSLDKIAKLGDKIQTDVFKNNKETVYEVVP